MKYILAATALMSALVALAVGQGPRKNDPQNSAAGAAAANTAAAVPAAPTPSPAAPSHADDENAIQIAANAFAAAYNSGNAREIAAAFVPEGEIVDGEGHVATGREAIEQVFAGVFKEHPKTHIELARTAIRLLTPDLAIEEGTSTVTYEPGEAPEHTPYVVVYSKQGGRWLTASARDLPAQAASPEEHLQELAWLVGDWVDESPDAMVFTSYHWSESHCYLVGQFRAQVGGQPVMTGTHRIGWDPLDKKIHSWVFDSEGGFAQGRWTRQGKQWIVKMTGVRHDGEVASSTNITTFVSKDRMTWQSRDRLIGDERSPDIEEITIVRQPPKLGSNLHNK